MGCPSMVGSGPVTSYSNIALAGSGKKGILKKLDGGYYEIILGAFAAFANGGWIYDTRTAMRYMENDKEFLDTLQSGKLRSEWGHPIREAGMSDKDWYIRICTIQENNTSSHIRRVSVSMDTVTDERGRKVAAIIGEVCPSGFKANEFRNMLENPHEDVNYSIRCFAAKDFRTMHKHINRIITWDSVSTPGIKVASKYKTPSLESKQDVCSLLDEAEFNINRLRSQLTEGVNDASFESNNPYLKILNGIYEDSKVSVSVPRTLTW